MAGNFPALLPGCDVLPALEDDRASRETPSRRTKSNPAAKRRSGDRFAVLNAFVDGALAGLSRGEVAVWIVLYRDSRDGIASSSQVDVARRAGISDRSVRRAMVQLMKCGLLRIVFRGGINRGVSRYHVSGQRAKP